jgi:hypothetical protein
MRDRTILYWYITVEKYAWPGQIAPTVVPDDHRAVYTLYGYTNDFIPVLWIGNVLMPIWIRIRPLFRIFKLYLRNEYRVPVPTYRYPVTDNE